VRGGLDFRTNLYYLETRDFGKTWQTVDGKPVSLPLKEVANTALIHDYDSEERNVYIGDVNYDQKGRRSSCISPPKARCLVRKMA
jgi:hypothetical protein